MNIGFQYGDVFLQDGTLEGCGDDQDEVVRRWVRALVSSWRDLDGITAA